jgi:Uma2 family endonuclease
MPVTLTKPARRAAPPAKQFDSDSLVIEFGPLTNKLTDDDFLDFCARNRDLRIEMTSEGEMIIMMPVGGEGGGRNFTLTGEVAAWVKADGSGKGFDSFTGFKLPNGAKRSPDLAWIRRERWERIPEKPRRKFPPICPDFVVELRSETDRLPKLKEKMDEYIENGALLGWLVDPIEKKVYIYRPNEAVEILENPRSVSGEPLLNGLKLDLSGIIEG